MVTIGIVGDLSRILEDFMSDPDVVTEVFCVIACLADLGECSVYSAISSINVEC